MLLYLLASLFGLVAAKAYPPREPTSTFKWDVSYVTAAPDGVPRPVIGVNGQFPPPTIEVKKHDVVELQITNLFTDGESLSVHSHGLLENGTNFYDGVPQVTQWYQTPETQLMKVELRQERASLTISMLASKLGRIGFIRTSLDNTPMGFVHHSLLSILIRLINTIVKKLFQCQIGFVVVQFC